MDKSFKKLKPYLLDNDSWLFLALYGVLAAERTINQEASGWSTYWGYMYFFLQSYLPILSFEYFKGQLKEKISRTGYIALWLALFGVYNGVMAYLLMGPLFESFPFLEIEEYGVGVAFLLAVLDLSLEAVRYWKKGEGLVVWIQKINLEKALLWVLVFFSLLFAMMVASHPEALQEQRGIVADIDFLMVLKRFLPFLAYALQFFIILGSLYIFYLLNEKLLVPVLLKKRGLLAYALGALGSIAFLFPILAQLMVLLPLVRSLPSLMPQGDLQVFTELNALLPFIVLSVSLPVIMSLQWFQQNQAIHQLEQQQVEGELSLLKQQINPHFFFNTLNNLYALSLEQSEQSPEVIMRLSELMRYVIYKGQEQSVEVKEEIAYLQDYLSLQEIRLHKKLDLKFDIELNEEPIEIPPLLLIILVENAFKHGIEPAEGDCFLHMDLTCDGHKLTFGCKNSFENTPQDIGGIGLKNLKRRLELSYPGRHKLETYSEGSTFFANLELWTA